MKTYLAVFFSFLIVLICLICPLSAVAQQSGAAKYVIDTKGFMDPLYTTQIDYTLRKFAAQAAIRITIDMVDPTALHGKTIGAVSCELRDKHMSLASRTEHGSVELLLVNGQGAAICSSPNLVPKLEAGYVNDSIFAVAEKVKFGHMNGAALDGVMAITNIFINAGAFITHGRIYT